MADKDVTNAQKARDKWAQIQKGADGTIDKLAQGIAVTSDVKLLSTVLAGYDELAQETFDAGVDAMAAAAREAVQRIEKDRADKGKGPLSERASETLFERAFNRELLHNGPALARQLEAVIERGNEENGAKLDQIHRDTSTLLRISKMFGRKSGRLMDELRGRGATADQAGLVNGGNTTTSNTQHAPGLGQPAADTHDEDGESRGGKSNRSTLDKLKDLVSKLWNRSRKDKDKDRESWFRGLKMWFGNKWKKTKDAWNHPLAKAIRAVMGAALVAPNFFTMIGDTIRTYLTWDNIKKSGEYVWNEIKENGPKFLDWVGRMAKEGYEKFKGLVKEGGAWLLQKIRMLLPEWAGGYSKAEKEKIRKEEQAAQTQSKPADNTPGGSTPVSSSQASSMPGVTDHPATGTGVQTDSGLPAATPKSETKPVADNTNLVSNNTQNVENRSESSTTLAPSLDAGSTTVNNTMSPQGGSKTTSASDTKIEPVKSIVTDAPKPAEPVAGGGKGQNEGAASSKVGLGSFGITAGVDDSLALMNMGILAS